MNDVLTTLCFCVLLTILVLPLGLIVAQFIADATRQRKHKAVEINDDAREIYAFFF